MIFYEFLLPPLAVKKRALQMKNPQRPCLMMTKV